MLDEFEDDLESEAVPDSAAHSVVDSGVKPPMARLVSRLYRSAGRSLRTRMVACLVRPLGVLGLAGIASGAFAGLLYRGSEAGGAGPIGDLAAYSSEQVFELARFVEQVSPDAIQQLVGIVADNPVGVSAFSAAVVALLVRAALDLRGRSFRAPRQPASQSRAVLVDDAGRGSERISSGLGSMTALDELVRRARERPN